jgi:hypothetical protein
MININDNSRMTQRIVDTIAREYQWPGPPTFSPSRRQVAQVGDAKLKAYTGRYELANNQMLTIGVERGHLVALVDGLPDEEFLPESDERFYSAERDIQIAVLKDGGGDIRGFSWKEHGQEKEVPRIGPLFHSLKPRTDPDPARTEKVNAVLKAFAEGGKPLAESPYLTVGARAELKGPVRDLAGLRSLVFLLDEDVSSRRIERHKGSVSRVLHYRLVTDKTDRGLLIHLTPEGQVTDLDIVDD